MYPRTKTLLFLCMVLCVCTSQGADPCTNYEAIHDQEKRSVNYTIDIRNDLIINDIHMTGNIWYRPITRIGTDMPTFPPDMFRCCTKNPIWLNGKLPEYHEGIVTRTVCTRTFTNVCAKSWTIDVKRCPGDYYVYLLKAAQLEASAYCFGSGGVPCPEGQSSQTGYIPDCVDSGFPNTTLIPEVESTLDNKYDENGLQTVTLQSVFRCNLGSDFDESLYFDIHWYINGHYVIHFENMKGSVSSGDLLPEHWVHKHHMNMVVKCSVRFRFEKNSLPGKYLHSSTFDAGVFPVSFQHEVLEGQHTILYYNVTVVPGCRDYQQMGSCNHILYISQPNYQLNQRLCSGTNIRLQDLAFDSHQKCGLVIPSDSANTIVSFNTTGYIDGRYNYDKIRSTKIRLISMGENEHDPSHAWDFINIPDIEVRVRDADYVLSNRLCQSYNDPHFYTSDRRYYDFYGSGLYVLYKHKSRPYEVQVAFAPCYNRASCNCAIAIRSGESLVTMVTSKCKQYVKQKNRRVGPIVNFNNRVCNDKSLILENDGTRYTATFPIGTQVVFKIGNDGFITFVNVKPSVLDIEESEGLCGFVSKNNGERSDDFTMRNGTITTNSQAFAKSWAVLNRDETLFVWKPTLTKDTNYLSTYCECLTESDSIQTQNYLQCNLQQPMETCHRHETDNMYSYCSGDKRRRRDVNNDYDQLDDVNDDFEGLFIDPSIYETTIDPESYEWKNNWTPESARETCTTFLMQRFPDELSEASGVEISDYIDSCVADIKITGGTEFMYSTLSAMQSSAFTELKLNETLQRTTTNEGITVFEKLAKSLCENNCSNHGQCVSGSCVCDENYGDLDCSMLKSTPPSDVRLPGDGLCGTRSRPCRHTNVYGRFSSKVVACRRHHFRVVENEKQYTSDPIISNATTVYDAFKVSCEIDPSRKKRSIDTGTAPEGYDISVSNDGKNFGDSVTIIIYDELCFSCNASTSTCEKLSSCPKATDDSEELTKKIGVIIGAIALVLLVFVAAMLYCKWKKSIKSKHGQTEPYMVDDYECSNVAPHYQEVDRPYTELPTRPSSASSVRWVPNNEGERKTPEHLFYAKTDGSVQ